MKTSEIVAAVENGAKWEWRESKKTHSTWVSGRSIYGLFLALAVALELDVEVRLKPQKKTVSLGPEDWDGVWWISEWARLQPSLYGDCSSSARG